MRKDKFICLGESYIEIDGDEKKVAQLIDDILKGKIKMETSTKSLTKTPVKLTKKNLKKYLKSGNFTLYKHFQVKY